jgi:hypothetical protein
MKVLVKLPRRTLFTDFSVLLLKKLLLIVDYFTLFAVNMKWLNSVKRNSHNVLEAYVYETR